MTKHPRRCAMLLAVAVSFSATTYLTAADGPQANTLSESEKRGGWKLLFDGKSTEGWRTYQKDNVAGGWKAEDGALVRVSNEADDLVSVGEYDNFELQVQYKISEGGNSGLMFHVTEDSEEPWHSGPEIQILDNAVSSGGQKAGYLYDLYPAKADATRPAGQWNEIYLRITPELCEVYLNGLRYNRFVLGSDEWNERVANSKFAEYADFGKAGSGHICLQEHGHRVAFRNIKIREFNDDGTVPDPVDGTLALKPEVAFPNLEWADWSPVDERGRPQPLRPIAVTHAGDGSNRVFVPTQRGVIYVFENDQQAAETKVFLDISDQVRYSDDENEEGFLGLTFHPDYKSNGRFVVYYTTTDKPHTSVISQFRVSKDDPDKAVRESEEEILRIDQPFWNHNGGTVLFGPDSMLYIGLGDGGAANDPFGNGQKLGTLLGSMLRIDVVNKENGTGYAIPEDNPFVEREGVRGEIWAYGLRNVWRMSFDRATGTLWAADVGQNLWEEVDLIVKGGNYGWNHREGRHIFGSKIAEQDDELIEPIWEYDHTIGKSMTGGVVYRGERLPELQGAYLHADYVSGKLFALRYDEEKQQVVSNHLIPGNTLPVISFGDDETGDVYFTIVASDGRGIYRFARTER